MGKLSVNAAVCDMTTAAPESLSMYDGISINTSLLIVSKSSKQLLTGNSININMAEMIELEDGCEVCKINGDMSIGPNSSKPLKPVLLFVNGELRVSPGSGDILSAYAQIKVNGDLILPESIPVSNVKVNGNIISYPDDTEIDIMDNLEISDSFIRTAKPETIYYITDALKDLGCDPAPLYENKVSIICSDVVVREKYEKTLSLIVRGRKSWECIPDGFSYIRGIHLDHNTVYQYGTSLYITGDFLVSNENANLLESLDKLHIKGKAIIPEEYVKLFNEKCVKTGSLVAYKGEAWHIVGNNETLNQELLQDMAEGVTIFVSDGILKIAGDVTGEDIRDKMLAIYCDDSIIEVEKHHKMPLRKKVRGSYQITVNGEEEETNGEEPAKEDVTSINTSYYKF